MLSKTMNKEPTTHDQIDENYDLEDPVGKVDRIISVKTSKPTQDKKIEYHYHFIWGAPAFKCKDRFCIKMSAPIKSGSGGRDISK